MMRGKVEPSIVPTMVSVVPMAVHVVRQTVTVPTMVKAVPIIVHVVR
jgi:hypothetical protein